VAAGEFAFREPGGDRRLRRALDDGLRVTASLSVAAACDAVVIAVGTPIDEHRNPQMGPLLDLLEDLAPDLGDGELVVLRSTVYPGTTRIVERTLGEAGLTVGEDVYLSFAPERVAQHNAFEETVQLPQLVGAVDAASRQRTESLFSSFIEADCRSLSPTEAELGKLFTNMWRYLTFAAANEFYLIADTFAAQHDVNIHRILAAASDGYPRFDAPTPGANVGGPCLTKDGWFLVDNIPYNELVSAAYQINEGMPAQLIARLRADRPDPDKVGVLGMTFKADSDDTRNSVSFKLLTQLRLKGIEDVVAVEPNVDGFDDISDLAGADWVVLMTPHEEFSDLKRIHAHVGNDDCRYCDIWGFWDVAAHHSANGYFAGADIDAQGRYRV
jgi:UDP-N-acetyl-D-mannosaminuronic acid dehydrogenase